MLDRLQESLEKHHLPHYIMPQSNLLRYEDPIDLKEATVIVAEVRRNILPKTVSLLKRLQSLSYQSHTYLQNVGLQLEDHGLKMQEKHLSEEDHRDLLRSLHSLFVGKCKNVIESLRRITPDERQKVEKMLNVALYAYQSILARNLCKLWFLMTKNDESKNKKDNEDDFKSYVKEEVKDLSFDDDFVALSLVFFQGVINGMEPSLAIPSTTTMKLLSEEQMKIAMDSVESSRAPFKEKFDWLKASDFKEMEEKVSRKLRETHTGGTVAKEEIESLINEELAALFEERMKEKK